jgi:tRNA(fMet)-specific endonuclease VapC
LHCISQRKPQAVKKLNRYFSQYYLSTIIVAELYKSVYYSQQASNNIESLQQFTDLLSIELSDLEAAIEFGKIQNEPKKIGKPTGELDALIAAVARSRNDILVTNNIKYFTNIFNLQLENWLENYT